MSKGAGNKVQEALKKQHDELKNLKKEESQSNRKEKDQVSFQLKRQKKRNATMENKKKLIFYLDGSILSKSCNIKSYALINSLLMSSNVRQRMGFLFPFDSLNRYLQ